MWDCVRWWAAAGGVSDGVNDDGGDVRGVRRQGGGVLASMGELWGVSLD